MRELFVGDREAIHEVLRDVVGLEQTLGEFIGWLRERKLMQNVRISTTKGTGYLLLIFEVPPGKRSAILGEADRWLLNKSASDRLVVDAY